MATIHKVAFDGINRNIDEGVSKDGQCMELVNMRMKNGSLEPMGIPFATAIIPADIKTGLKSMHWHPIARRYITLNTGQCYWMKVDENNNYSVTYAPLSDNLRGADDVVFLGNIAVFKKSGNIVFAIFRNDGYDYLGSAPSMPEVTFTCQATAEQLYGETSEGEYYNGRTSRDVTADQTIQFAATGIFRKLQYNLGKAGYFAGTNILLFRYAYRLSSGDYFMHSPIIIYDGDKTLTLGEPSSIAPVRYPDGDTTSAKSFKTGLFMSYTRAASGEKGKFRALTLGQRPQVSVNVSGLGAWSGLVTGIDLFVAPISYWKEEPYTDNYTTGDSGFQVLKMKTSSEVDKEIENATLFYKFASYDLNGAEIWRLDDVNIDNIVLQDRLPNDNVSHNTFSGGSMYAYNSRLHVANLTETFFSGFPHNYTTQGRSDSIPGSAQSATIYTYIDTPQGEVLVSKNTTIYPSGMNPIIQYPDKRAKRMLIATGGRTYSFDLKPHPAFNIAYYYTSLQTNGIGNIEHGDPSTVSGYITANGNVLNSNHILQTVPSLTVHASIVRDNVLKVSAVNNPLSFPADQTYQPSMAEIVGMCANTTALSQGQHGHHPLYVFAKDGVYSMHVGSGSVAYGTTDSVSRDVCTNGKSIKGTDKAVVFATSRGLMLIQGSQAECISEDLDGFLPSCVNSSSVIGSIATRSGLNSAISSTEFRNYIENAKVAYSYQMAEIYVSNPSYNYAYVYGLKSRVWSKIYPNVTFFVDRYPGCFAYRSTAGKLFDMENRHRSVSNILLMTRPIKLGTNDRKRVLQIALRGILRPSESDLYLRGEVVMFRNDNVVLFDHIGMYLLGSNDAEHFTLVSGREEMQDLRDLITHMNKSKAYKYWMFALAGGMRTDVSINLLEMSADTSFDNRLR